LPHLIAGEADQAAAAEGQKKKKKKLYPQANHLARLRQSFCLNNNTRIGSWKSNTGT
jgi:hypothetical protein